MATTTTGSKTVDLWSELVAAEEAENCKKPQHQKEKIPVVYRRKQTEKPLNGVPKRISSSSVENGPDLVPIKRISWNRALSTRGRTSIAVVACVDRPHQQKKPTRKGGKPPLPKGKTYQLPSFEKEKAYFQEVDSFELLEESPSPKKSGTWVMNIPDNENPLPYMSSVLRKWLIAKKRNQSGGLFGSLSKIFETPSELGGSIHKHGHESLNLSLLATPEIQSELNLGFIDEDGSKKDTCPQSKGNESIEDVEIAIGKLSLTERQVSFGGFSWSPLSPLLDVCGQAAPVKLLDIFSKYCDPNSIVKVGEGTFGEAFRAGENVCKIVPFGGELKVNGEMQKRPEELLEEAVLSCTLNHLRKQDGNVSNFCSTFIETKEIRVCQGPYDDAVIRAWEKWDGEHVSENDHPKNFPEKQCYIVFVQEHGGKDLESFVLLNFDEARSLLIQVIVGLAVAEAAYEFEHRDLHWGNILLSRKESATFQFILEEEKKFIRTFGLSVSIIDFTLSRINTGEDILFLDLSLDPELFEGPKRDKQSETYRKMKEVTEECWEGSFPKTNVLWLQYLAEILLVKKTYDRTSKDERDLRSLKKRLNNYNSAREAISDPLFSDLFVDHAV